VTNTPKEDAGTIKSSESHPGERTVKPNVSGHERFYLQCLKATYYLQKIGC